MRKRTKPLSPEILDKAIQYMADHCREAPRLAAVAKHVGVSHFEFCRRFHATAGQSFKQLLTEFQIIAVQDDLSKTALPVAAIAARCGFCCSGHLSLRFRQFVGMTPSAWRKECTR